MVYTVFLVAAVIGGTVMLCQFALTVFGLGDHGDHLGHGDFHDAGHDFDHGSGAGHDADAGADGDVTGDGGHADSNWLFAMITFRTLVAATAFFGIAGAAAHTAGVSDAKALAIAFAVGFAAMYGMYWLLRQISRLASSGTERIGNALGRVGRVYIPIPAAGSGAGKVQLSMQNRIVELTAVTDDADPLRTGESVEVVAVTGSDQVRVRRVAQAVEA